MHAVWCDLEAEGPHDNPQTSHLCALLQMANPCHCFLHDQHHLCTPTSESMLHQSVIHNPAEINLDVCDDDDDDVVVISGPEATTLEKESVHAAVTICNPDAIPLDLESDDNEGEDEDSCKDKNDKELNKLNMNLSGLDDSRPNETFTSGAIVKVRRTYEFNKFF